MSEGAGFRRIALLGHRLASPTATGIARYYVELSKGLAAIADRDRHRYTVASPSERERPTWIPDSLELRSLGAPRRLRTLSWAAAGRPLVDRSLGNPDLVHAMHAWAPTPTRAPLVTTIHDVMPVVHAEWYDRTERWLFGRAISYAHHHASAIIAPSAFSAAAIVAETPIEANRVHVVWEGVAEAFRQRPSELRAEEVCRRHGVASGRYLVAVGAVSHRKNLSVLIRALAEIDPALLGRPSLLLIGPPGDGASDLRAEVDRLDLARRVRFAGYVASDELPVLMGSSLALVHPSRDEGFGITPVEAMAAGVPAIASNAGSIPEITGAAAILVDPDDVDGWAAAITAVALDEDHRNDLITAGHERQELFRWERAAAQTLALHDQVLDSQ